MGMDPFNFADALLGILAQRLAKRLCDCKQEYLPDATKIKTFVANTLKNLRHTAAWKADYAGEARKLV
jgi:type II secretory ATPase GspE/PulE/Tfp pilus assembly ATPase PilB-like protein